MHNVDIVIVTYNAKAKLGRCIRSIRKNTRHIPYTLTIVDNHCTDGTSDFLKSLGDMKIITSRKNLGFSGGANLALKATSAKYIALVDDDAEVTQNWLKKLYHQINQRPDIGIVGCKIIFPDRMIFCAEIELSPGYCHAMGHGERDNRQRDYIKTVDAVCGACWLMRRGVIKKIGFFDEQFFPCKYEDCDYCLRATRAGFQVVYEGKVSIIHHNLNRDGKSKIKALTKNRRLFMRKWKNLKDFAATQEHLGGGIDNGSSKNKYYLSRAVESVRDKNYGRAVKHLRDAIRFDPYNLAASYYLAM
ncbi:MAG: glycosyltransferase family 2 protein, partial [Candidatus Omnitrophica bacterium]|nr:glycosyltransferase family 2 protein [Candidatus Omnitrophota bacterium]